MQHCYKCSITYPASVGACPSCHPRGNCENSLCNNLKYYDSRYGPFPYCSLSCRDQHLLPGYNQKLREHIESANNSTLLDQQIYKQDAKIEKCVHVGSEPICDTIVDVSTPVCSDQELLSKYGTSNENEKDPSSSEAFKAGSLPDNSINKDLIVSGMMSSDAFSPPVNNHGMINFREIFPPVVVSYLLLSQEEYKIILWLTQKVIAYMLLIQRLYPLNS